MTDAFIFDHLRSPRGRGKQGGALNAITPINLATQVLAGLRDLPETDILIEGGVIRAVGPGLAAEGAAIASARVMPFNLPPIIGLGTGGGFEYQLEDLQGRAPEELAAAMRALVLGANRDPNLERVFSTWATNNPQVFLDIDREKAQTLGVTVIDEPALLEMLGRN